MTIKITRITRAAPPHFPYQHRNMAEVMKDEEAEARLRDILESDAKIHNKRMKWYDPTQRDRIY